MNCQSKDSVHPQTWWVVLASLAKSQHLAGAAQAACHQRSDRPERMKMTCNLQTRWTSRGLTWKLINGETLQLSSKHYSTSSGNLTMLSIYRHRMPVRPWSIKMIAKKLAIFFGYGPKLTQKLNKDLNWTSTIGLSMRDFLQRSLQTRYLMRKLWQMNLWMWILQKSSTL